METLGRYEIIKQIGEGGMASVFLANDPHFNRKVAIKLSPETTFKAKNLRYRFEREAQIIASLEHHAIVPVYDFGEQNEQLFLVMRYMPGGTLSDRLRKGTLTLKQSSRIINRIAAALDEAHANNIVHRDLKPGNILFDKRNNAFLSDFGIVKVSNATTLTSNMIIGTPAYMSPEQAQGQVVDSRSDVYSLGLVLFEMLTGELPFKADTPLGWAIKRITEPVPNILELRSDLTSQVQELINRALAKSPNDRFESAGEFASTLESIILNDEKLGLISHPASNSDFSAEVSTPLSTISHQFHTPITPQATKIANQRSNKLPIWLLMLIGVVILSIGLLGGAIFNSRGDNTQSNEPIVIIETNTSTPTKTSTIGVTSSSTSTNVHTASVTPTSIAVTMTSSTATATAAPIIIISTEKPCPPSTIQIVLSSINFRTGPGTNYPTQIPVLFEGDTGTILGKNGNSTWFNIEVGERIGWVNISGVELIESQCDPIEVALTIPASPIPSTRTPIPPTSTSNSVATSSPGNSNPPPQPTPPPIVPTTVPTAALP